MSVASTGGCQEEMYNRDRCKDFASFVIQDTLDLSSDDSDGHSTGPSGSRFKLLTNATSIEITDMKRRTRNDPRIDDALETIKGISVSDWTDPSLLKDTIRTINSQLPDPTDTIRDKDRTPMFRPPRFYMLSQNQKLTGAEMAVIHKLAEYSWDKITPEGGCRPAIKVL